MLKKNSNSLVHFYKWRIKLYKIIVILMTFSMILKKISQFVNCFFCVYGLFPHLGKKIVDLCKL
jgi:hypothetical protein